MRSFAANAATASASANNKNIRTAVNVIRLWLFWFVLTESEQNCEVKNNARSKGGEAVGDNEAEQVRDREEQVHIVKGESQRPAVIAKAG